ncbi:hypothetical protein ONZ45_g17840 [Pleurotus djamor]|nr:hypothetical protein ONZ45_g17840 [Pleurotus djamor]
MLANAPQHTVEARTDSTGDPHVFTENTASLSSAVLVPIHLSAEDVERAVSHVGLHVDSTGNCFRRQLLSQDPDNTDPTIIILLGKERFDRSSFINTAIQRTGHSVQYDTFTPKVKSVLYSTSRDYIFVDIPSTRQDEDMASMLQKSVDFVFQRYRHKLQHNSEHRVAVITLASHRSSLAKWILRKFKMNVIEVESASITTTTNGLLNPWDRDNIPDVLEQNKPWAHRFIKDYDDIWCLIGELEFELHMRRRLEDIRCTLGGRDDGGSLRWPMARYRPSAVALRHVKQMLRGAPSPQHRLL